MHFLINDLTSPGVITVLLQNYRKNYFCLFDSYYLIDKYHLKNVPVAMFVGNYRCNLNKTYLNWFRKN